jgi:hypothetical protein
MNKREGKNLLLLLLLYKRHKYLQGIYHHHLIFTRQSLIE